MARPSDINAWNMYVREKAILWRGFLLGYSGRGSGGLAMGYGASSVLVELRAEPGPDFTIQWNWYVVDPDLCFWSTISGISIPVWNGGGTASVSGEAGDRAEITELSETEWRAEYKALNLGWQWNPIGESARLRVLRFANPIVFSYVGKIMNGSYTIIRDTGTRTFTHGN